MSRSNMVITFQGPYSWHGGDDTESIFTAEIGRKSGVYLWTVKHADGELIYYVGETGRSFAVRMLEHFKEYMSGGYHLYDPTEFARGVKAQLWPGRYDPQQKTNVREFLECFNNLKEPLGELAKLYRFYVASLECDKRLRQRIEASLADHLYQQGGIIGGFQDRGIRYQKRRASETPVTVTLQATARLLGIPNTLEV